MFIAMFYSFFALQMLPELGAEPHSVPTNDEHSVPPYLFHSPNLALVLGLFCAPIKQNLAHLTFKYQNSKHFTTKFHFINPFSISKNLPKTLSFLFFFFFFSSSMAHCHQYHYQPPKLSSLVIVKQNKTLNSQPSSVLTLQGKKKQPFSSCFLK